MFNNDTVFFRMSMRKFNEIAQEQLGIRAEDMRDDLTPKDVPHWDSMNYLLFIAELEKEYDIAFSMDEVLGAQTLGAIKEIARTKGALV
jgi:acyl carrier protein